MIKVGDKVRAVYSDPVFSRYKVGSLGVVTRINTRIECERPYTIAFLHTVPDYFSRDKLIHPTAALSLMDFETEEEWQARQVS